MRFRQRFPWVQLGSASIWIVLSIAWVRRAPGAAGLHSAWGLIGVCWLFLLVWALVGYAFIWWDICDEGLAERRLWRTKCIAWGEVSHVGLWRPVNKPIGETLEVEYARSGPMSDRGSIVLLPLERQAFLSALHNHAPQATFEL